MATTAPAALPLVLGKYQTLSPLGEGGMGRVFLARSLATGAQVVVKLMHGHLADNPTARAGFQRELEVMKRFRHPGAVALLDGGWDGPTPCLVLEYVRGVNLEKHTEPHRRIEPRRLGRWLAQLCQVLHVAHGLGILHRDLSLANLMLSESGEHEHIKVMDFGLARLHGGVCIPIEKLTGSATTIGGGTPDYMCPEQIRGESVDARGDLYSVGVILFRLLTGRLPFENAKDTSDILQAHIRQAPPRFAQVGAEHIPLPLEVVTRLCLEKDPSERPQTARELADLYGEALGEPIAAPDSFPAVAAPPVVESAPIYDPRQVLDRVEAWMPEQIAVVKLRGFIGSVGGEIVDSRPGLLRMRLQDPRTRGGDKGGNKFSWFGLARPTLTAPAFLHLDLHMEKKQVGARSMVEIAIVFEPKPMESRADVEMREGFGQRLCKELRAYLMIGR